MTDLPPYEKHEPSSNRDHDNTQTCSANVTVRGVRYMDRGIFTIAYEPKWFINFIGDPRETLGTFYRVAHDFWSVAPQTCVAYYACLFWLTISPALSLSLASIMVLDVQDLLVDDSAREIIMVRIKREVSLWLTCYVLSYFAEVRMNDFQAEFSGPIRAYFLPRLVEARVTINSDELTDDDFGSFPNEYEYGTYLPGYDYFRAILSRVHHIGVILFEVLALTYLTHFFNGRFDSGALYLLTALSLFIGVFIPLNGAGGEGYTFWTKNADYNRLMTLFHMVFSQEYRYAIHKDGLTHYVTEEYKYASMRLNTAKTDYWIISWGIPVQWYWALPNFLINSCAVALYGILIPWAPSAQSMIATMIILQLVMTTHKQSIQGIRGASSGEALGILKRRVHRIYRVLDRAKTRRALLSYPTGERLNGAAFSLNNVSFQYNQSYSKSTFSMDHVHFMIEPGQLVVIAGPNGSGKSTLVKLLCGLLQPTEGDISVDGHKLVRYDINQYLQSMVYLGQSEAIYPACSIREHILLGLTSPISRALVKKVDVDEAAYLGGATSLVKQHGYDTVLNPRSIECYAVGKKAGAASIAALDMNVAKNVSTITLSSGEKQRLAASRAFMRLKHENVRLIVLDEATNALDSISEGDILEKFRQTAQKHGQTMIVVTHKLANIVKHADLILCMDNGKVVEQGTHDTLFANGGQYTTLYNGFESGGCRG